MLALVGFAAGAWWGHLGLASRAAPASLAARGLDASRPRLTPAVDAQRLDALAELGDASADVAGRLALTPLRELVRDAVAAVDPLQMQLAGGLLVERIGASVDVALEVLVLARESFSADELELLFRAVALSEAARDPRVVEALLGMAADPELDPMKRMGALLTLQTQPSLSEASRARLTALASDPALPELGSAVAGVLGSVVQRDLANAPGYASSLLTLAGSDVTRVRVAALESLLTNELLLGGAEVSALATIARTDGSAQARASAAASLAVNPDKALVLDTYARLFENEPDPYVRWNILVGAVRAGASGALPLLHQFAVTDPYFAEDVADFEAILASGEVDFEKVWLAKRAADERAGRTRPWEGEEGVG
ncbi:MAG: hypothetical protein IPK07_26560 [Deltaproteobacteria bacterium]|nr:hypothetical protein [Deltaproteobacteria bacterium]